MAVPPNLPTDYSDNIGQPIPAARIKDLALAGNSAANAIADRRIYDVQAFGAVPDSDGITGTDSTAAIQACIDAAGATFKGAVYFSPSRTNTALGYKVTSPLTLDGTTEVSMVLYGDAGASRILGSFNGFLIQRTVGTGQNGPIIIERLNLKNYGTSIDRSSGGISIVGTLALAIRNCTIKANMTCISLMANTFSTRIESVVLQTASGIRMTGACGIVASAHCSIQTCDMTGLTTGAALFGASGNVHGCRFETNVNGLVLGRYPDLITDFAQSAAMVAGCTFEGNDTAICAYHIGALNIDGISMQGSAAAPSGSSKYGFRSFAISGSQLSGINTNGNFDIAGISLVGGTPVGTVVSNCTAVNGGIGVPWELPADMSGLTLNQCNATTADVQANVFAENPSATAPAVATAGTISTIIGVSRVAPAAAVTGVILQAGTVAGQRVTVQNQSVSANSITFATDATSNVADGLAIVIPGVRSRTFMWNASTSRWYTT